MTTYFGQKSTTIRPVYTVFKKEGMRCNVKYIILLVFGGGGRKNYCIFTIKL